jgi:hypothetical protein
MQTRVILQECARADLRRYILLPASQIYPTSQTSPFTFLLPPAYRSLLKLAFAYSYPVLVSYWFTCGACQWELGKPSPLPRTFSILLNRYPGWRLILPTYLLAFWFLAWLIFNPEDGHNTFLWNDASYMDYTALYPRRWNFHNDCCENFRSYNHNITWMPELGVHIMLLEAIVPLTSNTSTVAQTVKVITSLLSECLNW